jgi:DNA recombination protein RmuC
MVDWGSIVVAILAGVAALFALLAFLRSYRVLPGGGLTPDQVSQLLRAQSDEIRNTSDGQARALREELGGTVVRLFSELGQGLGNQVKEFGDRLDGGVTAIDKRAASIGTKLDHDIAEMGKEAGRNRDNLRQTIEAKLDDAATKQGTAAKELREEIVGIFHKLGAGVTDNINQLGDHQKQRLDQVSTALGSLSEKHEKAQDALKQTVESRLDAIRSENAAKLDEMRKTVDEKLQSTLETRLGESLNRVVEQLERVHKGIGEMQSLAAGVGDLKKVLSNVRVSGTFGEVQLSMLLEQFLSPEQFIRNAQINEGSQGRVEFAIRLPGHDVEGEVLLPVDAKFPQEDYERLFAAADRGDAEAVVEAGKDLENRIRAFAKTIREKYIAPPRTTDFAILFLPTESLYAEILRRPGLFEQLQREYHVTLAGPTTFTALLNALQMGFRSLAIEKRSGEVWQILGAVRNEFGKYNDVVVKLSRQLGAAANSVEALGMRTRAMNRKLRDVETLPDATAQAILGAAIADSEADVDEEVAPTSG